MEIQAESRPGERAGSTHHVTADNHIFVLHQTKLFFFSFYTLYSV